ncbi:MAG: hypothetical protein IPJ28_11005 [Betaproteobacteria bacterium]|nr:hypothetical protein [Betaproteobacteria bacterium]
MVSNPFGTSLLACCKEKRYDGAGCVIRWLSFADIGRFGEKIGRFVYGPGFKREASKLNDIFPDLVQANVIDSFSAHMLEFSGAQENSKK